MLSVTVRVNSSAIWACTDVEIDALLLG